MEWCLTFINPDHIFFERKRAENGNENELPSSLTYLAKVLTLELLPLTSVFSIIPCFLLANFLIEGRYSKRNLQRKEKNELPAGLIRRICHMSSRPCPWGFC
jgi:hypothetical protein